MTKWAGLFLIGIRKLGHTKNLALFIIIFFDRINRISDFGFRSFGFWLLVAGFK
jgi:hypothetical protein